MGDIEAPAPSPTVTTVLRDVSLQVAAGEMLMIAGPTGSGKSTLLASLAGARPALGGRCEVAGRRAYVPQKPFLLNTTVQENILFGLHYDPERYRDAIQRVALEKDLEALSLGDQTLVGENGVQLSGGQKTRVALARAMYADADVLLLDDVLSAVDAHTGQHIWNHCIVEGLLQRGKTIALVSHQLQYLSRPQVSQVALLRSGRMFFHGPWSAVDGGSDELLRFVTESQADGEEKERGDEAKAAASAPVEPPEKDGEEGGLVSLAECQAAVARALHAASGRVVDNALVRGVQQSLAGEAEALEGIHEGGVTSLDLWSYLNVFGSWTTVLLLAALLLAGAVFEIMSNVWLSIWTEGQESSLATGRRNLAIYALIGVSAAAVSCGQSLVLTVCSLAASRKIHGRMFERVLSAPMSFFDESPTGRIMNRFLQDLQNIDNLVPDRISQQIVRSLNVVTQISLIYVEAPLVLITLPFLVIPYTAIFRRMRVPNRDTRRIGQAAHSPVYSHFSDTLLGRETVRAFGAERRFEVENLRHVEHMATACYGNESISKWAQALTTQWGSVLYCAAGLACAFLSQTGALSPSKMGLVLLYAASLQRSAMDYMMGTAELEKQFVSVERVAEYMRLEAEESDGGCAAALPSPVPASSAGASQFGRDTSWSCWPHNADIVLTGASLRYRLHRPLVLAGITWEIPSNAKVAICGRTGCGKSTIFAALSRLYPLVGGKIAIGGRDLAAVPLSVLRATVRVVSQDAFLVSGSLRRNLTLRRDSRVPDSVLWHCLDMVGMRAKAESLTGGLDARVEEGGQNFSVGEKQLLALARVLIPYDCDDPSNWHPPRIILCDEATANVDLLADEQIHNVLLNLDATVVMICHRLQYISRFGHVVVMDAGRIVEAGHPADLLARSSCVAGSPGSKLAQLCAEAGVLQ